MTNSEKILNYLAEKNNGFENCFLRSTVENILIYADEHFKYLADWLAFVEQILPNVTIDELRRIIQD